MTRRKSKYNSIQFANMTLTIADYVQWSKIAWYGGVFRYRLPGRGIVRKTEYPGIVNWIYDFGKMIAEGLGNGVDETS